MKVKELIEKLNKCDQNAEVVTGVHYGGYDRIVRSHELNLVLDDNREDWEGPLVESEDKFTINAVSLECY